MSTIVCAQLEKLHSSCEEAAAKALRNVQEVLAQAQSNVAQLTVHLEVFWANMNERKARLYAVCEHCTMPLWRFERVRHIIARLEVQALSLEKQLYLAQEAVKVAEKEVEAATQRWQCAWRKRMKWEALVSKTRQHERHLNTCKEGAFLEDFSTHRRQNVQ